MKTRILLVTLGAAALAAITLNANASDTYLTPRAAGNQINQFAGIYHDPNPVDTTGIVVETPRVAGNEAQTAAGSATETTPAMACAKIMAGSPKIIQACAEHPATMPGCNPATVASLK